MELPANYDPKDGEKRFYRHAQTGELGWAVRRDGQLMVRLNRPDQEIVRRLDESWIEEDATRPLTPLHVAKVCFAADKALCEALGDMERARGDWSKLSDVQRQAWIHTGPKRPAPRVSLYATLKSHLGKYLGNH